MSYDVWAAVYDQEAHIEIAMSFGREVASRAGRRRMPLDGLDLACGTGNVTRLLRDAGCRMVGVDLSAEMLRLAEAKCDPASAPITWVRADICRLPALGRFHLVTCCGDVINHFGDLDQVRAIFRGAYDALHPGGEFYFETLNRVCYETYWADETYFMESASGDVVMECAWDAASRRATARLVSFVRTNDDTYTRRETTLTEYLHERNELTAALRDAGFGDTRFEDWTPWRDHALGDPIDRTLWVARR
jgi:ubiquinone/menaquinone biosynthesis C-methylase UbiE